ncbi:MAG: hypothetical protein PHW10_01170 [Candidatus Peribacteraceae bacterium]|nr:hypothetical protein [Candidatus Peribacteraceae bacterium]
MDSLAVLLIVFAAGPVLIGAAIADALKHHHAHPRHRRASGSFPSLP